MCECLIMQFINQIARNSSAKTRFAVDDPSRDWETRFRWTENLETCVCRRQAAIAKKDWQREAGACAIYVWPNYTLQWRGVKVSAVHLRHNLQGRMCKLADNQ